MTTTTIQKWGNSYAVRLPKATMEKLKLHAGHTVEIHEIDHNRSLSIVPAPQAAASLSALVSRITKNNRHEAVGWGDAVGNESW